MAGWSSYQGRRQLERDVAPLRPRVVTLYFGWNDHWIGFGIEDKNVARVKAVFSSRWSRLRLVQLATKATVALGSRDTAYPNRVSLADFGANLRAMVRQARSRGIRPVLVTAASAHVAGEEPEQLTERWLRDLSELVPLHRSYVAAVRAVAAEMLDVLHAHPQVTLARPDKYLVVVAHDRVEDLGHRVVAVQLHPVEGHEPDARVVDLALDDGADLFLQEVVGTDGEVTTDEVQFQIRNVIVSRFPILDSWEVNPGYRITAARLDLGGAGEMLVIACHWRCCTADADRQEEADSIIGFLNDARAPGGAITLDAGTPIVLGGDLNLVGWRRQLETILTGDIVNEGDDKGQAADRISFSCATSIIMDSNRGSICSNSFRSRKRWK